MNDDEKQAYTRDIETQLQPWSEEIGKLKRRLHEAGEESKIALQGKIDELEQKKEIVNTRLNEIRDVSSEGWRDLRLGVERATYELSEMLSSAMEEHGLTKGK